MKNIIVQLQISGCHRWPDCNIKEVEYLKNKHRHVFHVEAKKRVFDNNREIEIISFKEEIKAYLESKNGDFGSLSCEMIAEDLLKRFGLSYVKVLEDNENGAEVWKR